MNTQHWTLLEKVKSYLNSKSPQGVLGFKKVLTAANENKADLVVITFTHEHPEALEKVDDKFQFNTALLGTINRYEIEEILDLSYDNTDRFADFVHSQLLTMTTELIKYWIANCFNEAKKEQSTTAKFYFKDNHDDMEIFDLNAFKTLYEQSEFETFMKNNQMNQMQLLQ